MSLLLSPHDDDSALFAAFTCLREHPTVVVVADSYVQPSRYEVGCSVEERAEETTRAHEILGCPVIRFGLHDDDLTLEQVVKALGELDLVPHGPVYVPALEGGHPQHDLVTRAAMRYYGRERLRCYSTYAKLSQYLGPNLQPVGTTEVEWTREEYAAKHDALACYESQQRVNPQHFRAVGGRSEWLSGPMRVHLGCGEQLWPGWVNIDRVVPSGLTPDIEFLCRDLLGELSMAPGSVDYVFSEDVLEHIPPDARVSVINRIWSMLTPGGLMEHYVPNAGSRNGYGSPTHLSHWNLQCFDHFDVDSHRWQKDRNFEGVNGGFRKVTAELVNWLVEEDGVKRAQSLHVIYRKVANA